MKDRTLLTGKRKPGGVGGNEGLAQTVAELIKGDCMYGGMFKLYGAFDMLCSLFSAMIGPLYCRNNQNPRRFEVGLMRMKGFLKLHDFASKTGFV